MKRLNLCGEQVRRLRNAQGLTQDQIQTTLSEYGLDTRLSAIEQGTCKVSDIELAILAKLFATSPEQLVFGSALPDKSQLREILRTVTIPDAF
jgi:transcriptional regulator with XRE-family HTH domain